MISSDEVKNIIGQLELKNGVIARSDLSEDVCCITYHIDIFKYGDCSIMNKHIDIEFIFGDYCEIQEGEAIYQYIFKLCNLQTLKADEEVVMILYQK